MTRRRNRGHRWILRPDGIAVERDPTEHEEWLAVHGETQGGALILSRDGDRAKAVTAPKVFFELGEPCGAIFGTDWQAKPPRMTRAIIYPVTGPGFIFDEKGLRDAVVEG